MELWIIFLGLGFVFGWKAAGWFILSVGILAVIAKVVEEIK